MSGWLVANNTVISAQMGIMVGGGRKNIVEGNRFIDCDVAIHVDDRGMGSERDMCNNQTGASYHSAAAVLGLPQWKKYNVTLDHPCVPIDNVIRNNCWTPVGHTITRMSTIQEASSMFVRTGHRWRKRHDFRRDVLPGEPAAGRRLCGFLHTQIHGGKLADDSDGWQPQVHRGRDEDGAWCRLKFI